MAGTWVRSGTIALTSGSKKVTGTGTAWNSGLNKVTKGCALKHNNIDYEVDYVNSDTELYLVDTYSGATLSGQAYRIQIAVTDTIPELSSRIAQALAYWNGQGANLQALVTGNGNVTLTAPDGTQVTIPSYGNMQPKDTLLTALAALTTTADKLVYFTGADTVDQTPLTSFARTLLDDIDAATARGTLGAQASDATLTALAGVVTAADKLVYATGVDTFSTATLTAFARTVLAGTDAAAILTTLGASKASIAETLTRTATDRVVTPAGLNAVVPYTPTVNPTLDLDFAKQKYKWYAGVAGLTESSTPSLMTFNRSSIATFFDAMGVMKNAAVDAPRIDYDPITGECLGLLIEESRTNLLTYTKNIENNSVWGLSNCYVIPNAGLSPDGTMTLAAIVRAAAGNHFLYSNPSGAIVANSSVTFSVWLKSGSYTGQIILRIRDSSNVEYALPAITITSTLTRYVATAVIPAGVTGTYKVFIDPADDVGPAGDVFYMWEPQLEVGSFQTTLIPSTDTWTGRSSTATYLDSAGTLQTAAPGVARSSTYTYDSNGVLQPQGLLLEAAGTNLLTYSEQFDNAVWALGYMSVVANAATALDGNVTADKLVETTAANSHHAWQSVTTVAGSIYTFSVYVKPAERTKVQLRVDATGGAGGCYADYDLTAGTVGSVTVYGSGATSYGATIVPRSNGWFRLSITVSHATLTSFFPNIYLHNGTTINYTGDGVSGVYTWGAQFEARQFATSYIQTTAAQVTRAADTSTSASTTRSADIAAITGVNFSQWYKQGVGTLYGEFNDPYDSVVNDSAGYMRTLANLSDGSDNNRIRFGRGLYMTTVVLSGNEQWSSSGFAGSKGKHKISAYYSNASASFAKDSVGMTPSGTLKTPQTLNKLDIGKGGVIGGIINGHIRSLKYFPKPLAALELQAMTA